MSYETCFAQRRPDILMHFQRRPSSSYRLGLEETGSAVEYQLPVMAEQVSSKDYGAIGSERRVKPKEPMSPPLFRGHGRRPSSWQDEVGNTTPNVPKTIGNLEPFNIEPPRESHQKYTRSTSFPESSSPVPAARLTQTRSLGQSAAYEKVFMPRAKDLGPRGLIPPSTQEEDFAAPGSSPDSSFAPLLKSPTEFVPTGIGSSQRPLVTPGSDVDSVTYTLDNLNLREGIPAPSGKAPYPFSRGSVAQQSVREETSAPAPARGMATPSPTFGSPEFDWEAYKRTASFPQQQLRARAQELTSSPTTREQIDRRGQSLLHLPTPQTLEQQRQAQLTDGEMMCLRLRDEVRAQVPDSEYPFLNGGPPNFSLAEYPLEVQTAVMNPLPRPENVYIVVVFKLHRASIYYRPEDMIFASEIKPGDMIVVQADRGEDVGFVVKVTANVLEAEDLARRLNTEHLHNLLSFVKVYTGAAARLARYQLPVNYGQDLVFKTIIRKAGGPEAKRLLDKEHDETKAKRIAEQKARERGLPMEILDAEFQADHGKLTIYYISEQYIVFKEFVDDMYKVYKMRVWMSSVNQVRPLR